MNECIKLIPYFNCVFWYFFFNGYSKIDLIWSTLLKCAPILYLILYIIINDYVRINVTSKHILYGLIFSCIGDALLNIDLFVFGMLFFALTQILYLLNFGWKPLKPFIGFILYICGIIFVKLISKNLNGILKFAVPIYVMLLLTMCWRACARAMQHPKKSIYIIICALGSIFFLISDTLIGIQLFLIKIPNAQIYIMLTYYTAQLAIVFSSIKLV